MALLAVLQHDAASVARLRAALGADHTLVETEDWTSLWDEVQRSPIEGCVVDIYDPFGPVRFRELMRLRRRQPALAIVVYADFGGRELDLFELGRHKIDGVLLAGADDTLRDIRKVVDQAMATAVAMRVARALSGRIPPLAVDALRWAIEHAPEAPSVADLADGLTLRPRLLAQELRRLNAPPARRLLLWGRLLRAAHMLRTGERSVEGVAYALGYGSGTSLARAFRRETGHPPTAVMSKGGIAWVLESFIRSRSRTRHAPVRRHRWGPHLGWQGRP